VKIKWLSNACVIISSEQGGSILCDPWVNQGANLGSWFHWPPIPDDFETFLLNLTLNGVFISHLHSDHYDPKFISKFSKLRPEVNFYIPEFSHTWLKESVRRVVSKDTSVFEIPTLQETEVAPGLTLTAFAADTCNPSICLVNIPCQAEPSLRGIDGVGVFRADGLVIVNANDAMAINLVDKIAANIGKADVLMGHYGGASPFPQCFPLIKNKKLVGAKVIDTALTALINAADALEVKYIFPFAGQYVLGGRLSGLNQDLSVLPLDKTVNILKQMTSREVLSVEPFGTLDFTNIEAHIEYSEPSELVRQRYLAEISRSKFIYESDFQVEWENPERDLILAANSVIRKSVFAKPKFDNSFVITDGSRSVTLNIFVNNKLSNVTLGIKPECATVTKITIPEALLKLLSQRRENFSGFTPLHWNQADGGSHFLWERTGDFDLNSHMLLNFFGT
jgi:UDP-MurNAc hydroxylase